MNIQLNSPFYHKNHIKLSNKNTIMHNLNVYTGLSLDVVSFNGKEKCELINECKRGSNINKVKRILNNTNIDVNYQDKEGKTALMYASEKGYTDIVEELLNRKDININLKDNFGITALMQATPKKNHLEIVKNLLNHSNIDVNMQNNGGFTALMFAAICEQKDAVAELLKHKDINVDVKDNNGNTALMYAERTRNIEIINQLKSFKF